MMLKDKTKFFLHLDANLHFYLLFERCDNPSWTELWCFYILHTYYSSKRKYFKYNIKVCCT